LVDTRGRGCRVRAREGVRWLTRRRRRAEQRLRRWILNGGRRRAPNGGSSARGRTDLYR
jgi:hypothetical protein